MKKSELKLDKSYLIQYNGNRFLARIDPANWPSKGVRVPLIIDKVEKPFSGKLAVPMPCFYDTAPTEERYHYFAEWLKSSPPPRNWKIYKRHKKTKQKEKATAAATAPKPADPKPAPAATAAAPMPKPIPADVLAGLVTHSVKKEMHAYADLLEFVMRDAISQKRPLNLAPLISNIQAVQAHFNSLIDSLN